MATVHNSSIRLNARGQRRPTTRRFATGNATLGNTNLTVLCLANRVGKGKSQGRLQCGPRYVIIDVMNHRLAVLFRGVVWFLLLGCCAPASAAAVDPLALQRYTPFYFLFRGKPAVLITSG